jgi:type II secretory ATPase GspE/PulE/Tfp pilus assembly ATPase PilB-like protein
MDCGEVRRHLAAYVRGQIDDEVIKRHIEGCASCQREMAVERLLVASFGFDHRATAEDPSVIRISHRIIEEGIKLAAKEIRLEPDVHGLKVVMIGTDGEVEDLIAELPEYVRKPLLARFKIMAGLDPGDKLALQHGTIPINWIDKRYNLEVEVSRSERGERVVLVIHSG